MIKREKIVEQKEHMRGGDGTVTLENWLTQDELCPNIRLASTLVLPKGAAIGTHTHEKETEIFYVLSGTAEYDDNGKTEKVSTGDVMVCYAGQTHAIRNVESEELRVCAVIITE